MQHKLNEAIRSKNKACEFLKIIYNKLKYSYPIDDKKYMESEINDLKL